MPKTRTKRIKEPKEITVPKHIAEVRRLSGRKYSGQPALLIARDILRERLWEKERFKFLPQGETANRVELIKLLIPDREVHPWAEKIIGMVEECESKGLKEILIHGATDSAKTTTLAMLILELFFEWPEDTSIYVLSPTKDATHAGVFAVVSEFFSRCREIYHDLDCIPGDFRKGNTRRIIIDEEKHPRAFIQVFTSDKLGNLVGKKAREVDKGRIIVVADELPEFQTHAIVRVLTNLGAVPNFLFLGSGNFALTSDPLGVLSRPEHPEGYFSLNIESSEKWLTDRGGICLRLDGHKSPNILMGKERFAFLPTKKSLEWTRLKEGGSELSPGYLRFARSFPCLELDAYTVTNMVKIGIGQARAEEGTGFSWVGTPKVIAGCDPGFGGDPGIVQLIKYGKARRVIRGRVRVADHVHLMSPPMLIPLKTMSSDADENLRHIEEQIVDFCDKLARRNNIGKGCFGYDFSMRDGITVLFSSRKERGYVSINSRGTPSEKRRVVGATRMLGIGDHANKGFLTEADLYQTKTTSMWFIFASLIDSKQLTGLAKSPKAIEQACKRRWKYSGKKKEMEDKATFKSNNMNESPNEMDATVIAIEVARRLGLALYYNEGGHERLEDTARPNELNLLDDGERLDHAEARAILDEPIPRKTQQRFSKRLAVGSCSRRLKGKEDELHRMFG